MGLKNRRLLLAKVETAYGTDAVPTKTVNAILCGSLDISPIEGDKVQRNLTRPYLGNSQDIQVTTYATVSFEVELAGGGAAGTAPQYGGLLQGCGFSETVTAAVDVQYLPVSTGMKSLSLYFQADGIKHVLLGALGSVSFDLTAAKLPTMKFSFTGLLGLITDSAIPTDPTYTAVIPVAVSTANTTPTTLHGYTPILESLTLDMANEVKYRSLINDERVLITDRKPKGTIKLDMPALAVKDFFAIAKNATMGTLAIQHGQAAGNIIVLNSATNGVGIAGVKYADLDGIDQLSMDLSFVPAVGNDEIKLTIK